MKFYNHKMNSKNFMNETSFIKERSVLETWSLPQTLFGLSIIISIYLSITLRIIPSFMKNRQPYNLKWLLLVYNAAQVLLSAYIVFTYTGYVWEHGVITKSCPRGEDLRQVLHGVYPYFLAKHLDLLDTVFFGLRKKENQITFLHLYHHAAMLGWTWLHVMYHVTDNFVVVGLLNSFVHMLMYTYYGLSVLGPRFAKFLWWKKHLTKIQLMQFLLVITNLHYQQKLSPCPIPQFFHYYCLTLIASFFVLFLQFYFKNYSRSSKVKNNLELKKLNFLLSSNDEMKLN